MSTPEPHASDPAPIPAEAYAAWTLLANHHAARSPHHVHQQRAFRAEAQHVGAAMGLADAEVAALFTLDNEALLAAFMAAHPDDERAVWLVWEARKWTKELFRWAMKCMWIESEASTNHWGVEEVTRQWATVEAEEAALQIEYNEAKAAWEKRRAERAAKLAVVGEEQA